MCMQLRGNEVEIPTPGARRRVSLAPAAGEMLHMAEPFLDKNIHPTVIVRAYARALEDSIKVLDQMAFPINVDDRQQMLNVVNSCIGTKFTHRFGNLMAVRAHRVGSQRHAHACAGVHACVFLSVPSGAVVGVGPNGGRPTSSSKDQNAKCTCHAAPAADPALRWHTAHGSHPQAPCHAHGS